MDNTRLYVGNIPFSTTEEALRTAFGEFGTVTDVAIPVDSHAQPPRPRGFAFVTMSTAEEAKAAIEGMNNQELEGRRLTVNEARPREDRNNGGGYRGSDSRDRRDYRQAA